MEGTTQVGYGVSGFVLVSQLDILEVTHSLIECYYIIEGL